MITHDAARLPSNERRGFQFDDGPYVVHSRTHNLRRAGAMRAMIRIG